MKNLTLTLVVSISFLLCHYTLLGQYDYNKYNFPEVTVRGLNLNFNSFGNYNNFKSFRNSEYLGFSYNMGADYFQFSNSIKKQKTDLIILQNNFSNVESSNFNPFQPDDRSFFLNVDKRQINRNYYNNETSFLGLKGKFYEINHRVGLSHDNDDSNLLTNASADVTFGLGFGRLEPLTEVMDAQFMMDDLLKAGIIQEKFSETDLYELAAIMAKVKNTRVFDFRRARIFQLTELSNWLKSKGIEQDITTFTIMNDNWLGNFTSQRVNGKRLTFSLTPWAQKSWSRFNNVNSSSDLATGGVAAISYVHAKNKSQYFGTESTLRLSHGINNIDPLTKDITTLTGSYGWIYNPNSRTTISLAPSVSFATHKFSDYAAKLSLPLNFNYFINNQARISGFLSLNWLSNDNVIFERPSGVNEFNSNFRSEVYSPGSNILTFEGSRFTINGGLTFSYSFF
jgi:hypothetical protein